MKVAILTSPNQWFTPYAKILKSRIVNSDLFYQHEEINDTYEVMFILAYHKKIESYYLKQHQYNLVIHESKLPEGKGWAPFFWQILEGKNEITFTMFEATDQIDNGHIYMQKVLVLNGFELHDELREKQANLTLEMCTEFLSTKDNIIPQKQKGEASFYKKRTPNDSQLDINKTLHEQFNLLRIVDNKNYPAFFEINGHKYYLHIQNVNEN